MRTQHTSDIEANLKKVIEETRKLLEDNLEWCPRYEGYATNISKKTKYHQQISQSLS